MQIASEGHAFTRADDRTLFKASGPLIDSHQYALAIDESYRESGLPATLSPTFSVPRAVL
jgi:hypothetical protein